MGKQQPRVLIFDVETSPNLAFVWGKYEQDVIDFEKEWYMMSFAYKWLDEKKTRVLALPDFDGYKNDKSNDKDLVWELWRLFSEADIIIAHNGDKFDIRKSNAKFLEHSYGPPSPYKTIDTLKIARRHFALNSNKLDDLGKILEVGEKMKHPGFALWKGCMDGNRADWKLMKDYNKQDVILLENIYLKLRPWHPSHPNMGNYGDTEACPKCGDGPLHKNGVRRTQTTQYQQYLCSNCGGYVRGTEKIDVLKPVFV